jgi:YidC/Oxa1 family membrane protein insertase
VIDFLGRIFGPLTDLISGVLELLHVLGTPWWLSIVLVTVLVRAVLSPLTVRQVKNVRAMQELRPEMEKIRFRYKDDRRKQQEALAELYRERRLNPLAAFVPVLVQMPVFVTMYQVIRYHEETLKSFAHGGFFGSPTLPGRIRTLSCGCSRPPYSSSPGRSRRGTPIPPGGG